MTDNITFRKILDNDKGWINEFIKSHWGSKQIVVYKKVYIPSELDGYIAIKKTEKIGLITYQIKNRNCEIVSLNSVIENKGIGTKLVKLVIKKAKKLESKKIWLITTNDNIKAIYFYQKLGFQLIKVHLNAVAESRKLKPQIPFKSETGVPIRDELEFELRLIDNY